MKTTRQGTHWLIMKIASDHHVRATGRYHRAINTPMGSADPAMTMTRIVTAMSRFGAPTDRVNHAGT
jgi:hypothetical protein